MTFRHLFAIAAALMLSGCISFSGLNPESNYANFGDDAIIVMGVSPRYRTHIFRGERQGGKWLRDQIAVKLNTFPEDGYIVARLSPRTGAENYGIGGILPDGIGFTSVLFSPCRGDRTITFDAPGGKVVYVGDIRMVDNGTTIGYEAVSDFEAAQAHMKKHFPLLANQLIRGGFEHPQLANTPCQTKLHIMLTVPRY